MLISSTPLLRLSQGHLNLLESCPRKFQHTYLEQLNSPVEQLNSPANREYEEESQKYEEKSQSLGSHFHLLMQQREMGLPIDSLLAADTKLQSLMSAFAEAAPEVLNNKTDNAIFRESEHYRTLQVQDYLLTVIYDLLIADAQQAQILDWKTTKKRPNKRTLAQNWQTLLYMYVLAETSSYLPENISMTYWFVQSEGAPQNITFTYSQRQHQQTAKKLNQLLSQLTTWLADYQQNQPFPQVGTGSKACDYCHFTRRCDRIPATEPVKAQNSLPDIANIQEVTI
ncbi:PD-(D/E)XK nuclease family protein [Anabaena sp. 4-3]|uniref:PD-(D/E)XK nuclease family protein n=1 Tax=Anabaena sp. 4-3 TaxID=1811979 RepID=UPI00082A33DC|nr:PD-(D/E)XK nuclease family protein [Anabaena sp. 4-3]